MEDIETRYSHLDNLETRDKDLTISGYAITFNSNSYDLGGFIEQIDKRALNGVNLNNVYMLRNHNEDLVLGSTKNGSLILEITERGLYFSVNLPDTERGRETYKLVKRGDLDSMSFGFTVEKDTWNMRQEPNIRNVEKIGKLFEISLVNFPAYEDSKISKRSFKLYNECKECKIEHEKEKLNPLNEEAKSIINNIKIGDK